MGSGTNWVRAFSVALLLLTVVSVAACGGTTATPSSAPATSATVTAVAPSPTPTFRPAKMVVALTSKSAVQWPYFIATAKGFYTDLKLDVQFVTAQSNTSSVQGVVSGSVNIGGGSPSALIQAVANGSTNLVVTGASVERPIYTLVAAKAVASYKDLKGKRVGVSSVKSTDGLWTRDILQANGINPDSDVEIIEVGGTAQRYQALKAGGVAATFLTQPVDLQALAEGFKELGKSTDIVKQITWESYSTSRSWAKENEDVLVRFLAAQRRAAQWFYDPKNRAEAIGILVKETNSAESDASATYDLWVKETCLAEDGGATAAGVQANIDLLVKQSSLPKPVKVEDILDTSYMAKAAKIGP